MRRRHNAQGAIPHVDLPRLAVQFEKQGARAVGMRFTDGEEFYDQSLARFDRDGNFLVRAQSIKKRWRGQNAHVGVGLTKPIEFEENVRIEKIAEHFVPANGPAELFFEALLRLYQIDGFKLGSRTPVLRLRAMQNDLLVFRGPAIGRISGAPGTHPP